DPLRFGPRTAHGGAARVGGVAGAARPRWNRKCIGADASRRVGRGWGSGGGRPARRGTRGPTAGAGSTYSIAADPPRSAAGVPPARVPCLHRAPRVSAADPSARKENV